MAVSLFPLMMHENQPRWKYYLIMSFYSCLCMANHESNYENIEKENRIDFWIGIGTATWSVAVFATVIGFIASDYLK